MLQCPICQRKYVEAVECCSTCGWDLTPYPLTFQLPEAFVEKERAKLAWAKQIWRRCLTTSPSPDGDAARTGSQSPLSGNPPAALPHRFASTQSQQQQFEQHRTLEEAAIAQLQSQLNSSNQELSQLQSQLEHLTAIFR